MAMAYFKAFYSYLTNMEPLTDAEAGQLFRALLHYAEDGKIPDMTPMVNAVFFGIKADIDRNRAEYDSLCEKRKESGRLGGIASSKSKQTLANQASASKSKQTLANQASASKSKQTLANQAKDKGLRIKDKGNNTYTSCMCSRFDEFWSAYPKKQAKQDAVNAWKKVSPDDALADRILAALDVRKRSQDWQKEDGKYIPLPATWLNGRRWEDEVSLPVKRVKQAAPERDYELEALYEPGGKYAS